MDSKPKRQLTDQQRANLAAGREKLKTLRADPEYSKAQKERREERKRERSLERVPTEASADSYRDPPRRSRRSVAEAAAVSDSVGYAASVPSLKQ
jgi:hypothetical protein